MKTESILTKYFYLGGEFEYLSLGFGTGFIFHSNGKLTREESGFKVISISNKSTPLFISPQFGTYKRNGRLALHTMIHQVKSWIRTTYSWVSDTHINRYLDEFCYRINRSQAKETIFNNIITRMVNADKIYQSKLIGG